MRANHLQAHASNKYPRLGIARGSRRGVAILWSVIGITVVALMSTAAFHLTRGEQMVNDNYDSGRRALYCADEALSKFYAEFRPGANMTQPTEISTVLDPSPNASLDEDEEGAVDTVAAANDNADLRVRNIQFENCTAVVTPTKIQESQFGDVYLLEAVAAVYDKRQDRPAAVRSLRTYASLIPPFKVRAALVAPGGIKTEDDAKHFHVDGKRKGKCGSGTSVSAAAAPKGSVQFLGNKEHIKDDPGGLGIDSTTNSYAELLDSLQINFTSLTDNATYANLQNFIDVPRDYPTLQDVPFGNFSKKGLWPIVVVHGSVNTDLEGVKGFGMLVVEGKLQLTQKSMSWRGLVLTGKGMEISDAHLHAHGAVMVGLNCTPAEQLAGTCKAVLKEDGKHLGSAYSQCDVESSWAQMLSLRPLTPSRHTRLY